MEFSKPARIQVPDSKHSGLSQKGIYNDMCTLALVASL